VDDPLGLDRQNARALRRDSGFLDLVWRRVHDGNAKVLEKGAVLLDLLAFLAHSGDADPGGLSECLDAGLSGALLEQHEVSARGAPWVEVGTSVRSELGHSPPPF